MSDRDDTRRSPRIPCDLPMEYHVKGDLPRDGRITKIGTVGALLATEEPIPLGAELVLSFRLPLSNRPIRTSCTVKWVDEQSVGVEFAHLNLQEKDEIWKFYARESARQRKARP